MTLELVAPTWEQLDARLRDAVARNPSNGPLAETVRAPIATLRLLARDAEAVLAGDPLAAERMRVTLHAAADAAALVAVARGALKQKTDDGAPAPSGLLRFRGLAVLEAAALRVAGDSVSMYYALGVITGLALQCGPAELLARLEPFGAAPDVYDNLLRLAVPAIVAAGVASRVYLRGHGRDPVERARWRCLIEVMSRMAAVIQPVEQPTVAVAAATAVGGPVWSAVSVREIRAVTVDDDGAYHVDGDFPWLEDDSFPADELAVVGARPGRPPLAGVVIEATGRSSESALDRLVVRFKEPVAWLGILHRRRQVLVERSRALLRDALDAVVADDCTQHEPAIDVLALVPPVDDGAELPLDPPTRTGSNQPPHVSFREPSAPDPDQPGPADGDSTGSVGSGRITVVLTRVIAADRDQVVSLAEVRDALAAIGARLNVDFDTVELPWVEDALAVVSSTPGGPDDPRVIALFDALARTAARTPRREDALWLAIVPGRGLLAASSTADGALGLGVATVAGLGACFLRLAALLASADPLADVRAGRLLVSAHASTVVGTPADLIAPEADRLRLIGTIRGAAIELVDAPRRELRAAGPRAPHDTGVIARSLDADGTELGRTAITAQRTGEVIPFAVLVPISPEVEVVELRRDGRTLLRVPRRPVAPARAALRLDGADGLVTATWTSARTDAPVALTVEVTDREGDRTWVPIGEAEHCAEDGVVVPLWRLRGARRIRLVACDGWNAIASLGEGEPVPAGTVIGPVAIRRVGARTLWAELPTFDEDEPDWRGADASAVRTGRVLAVPARVGAIELGRTIGGIPVVDTIALEATDAYRRP